MTPAELRKSPAPPEGASDHVRAMWHVARGEWDAAHELVQHDEGAVAAWIHAHLHRVEGDQDNAGYWYARAGKPRSTASLDDEWHEISHALMLMR